MVFDYQVSLLLPVLCRVLQEWGYGRKGQRVTWARKGGLAAVRAGLRAAGIHSLRQLQGIVPQEEARDQQRRVELAAWLAAEASAGEAEAVDQGEMEQQMLVEGEVAQPAQGTEAARQEKLKQQQAEAERARAVSAMWKKQRQAVAQQKLAGQMVQFEQALCGSGCGGVAAKHCVRGCCGSCCIKAAAATTAGGAACSSVSSAGSEAAVSGDAVVCARHKPCKVCWAAVAARHCMRGCCVWCCELMAAAEGDAAGPCLKHF